MRKYKEIFDPSALTDAEWEIVRVNSQLVISNIQRSNNITTKTSPNTLIEFKKSYAMENIRNNKMYDQTQQQIEG